MTGDSRIYCLDTSVIINLRRNFPEDIFIGLWEGFHEMAAEGRISIHTMVKSELDVKDDSCGTWVRKLDPSPLIEIDQDQGRFIKRMGDDYKYLAHRLELTEYKNSADPFLLATCFTRGQILVTDEGPQEWRLPHICGLYGIEYSNRFDLMRMEGWTF